MDRKDKKRLTTAQQKLQKLKQQLAGARKQTDEPEEIEILEREIAATEDEIKRLKES